MGMAVKPRGPGGRGSGALGPASQAPDTCAPHGQLPEALPAVWSAELRGLTFFHVYLDNLLLADHLGAAAALAAVLGVDALPLALALDAHGLDLLHHARPDLLDVDLHPAALAQGTLLHRPLLATDTWGETRERAPGSSADSPSQRAPGQVVGALTWDTKNVWSLDDLTKQGTSRCEHVIASVWGLGVPGLIHYGGFSSRANSWPRGLGAETRRAQPHSATSGQHASEVTRYFS